MGNVYFTLYKKKMGWDLSEPFQGMGWGQGHIVKILLAHRGNSTLITGREGERERERARFVINSLTPPPPPITTNDHLLRACLQV